MARRGKVRLGWAWLGSARYGKARAPEEQRLATRRERRILCPTVQGLDILRSMQQSTLQMSSGPKGTDPDDNVMIWGSTDPAHGWGALWATESNDFEDRVAVAAQEFHAARSSHEQSKETTTRARRDLAEAQQALSEATMIADAMFSDLKRTSPGHRDALLAMANGYRLAVARRSEQEARVREYTDFLVATEKELDEAYARAMRAEDKLRVAGSGK